MKPPVRNPDWAPEVVEIAGGTRAVLLLSERVESPVTFGWRRPVVLLPAGFQDLPLSAGHLLAAVIAARTTGLSGLDRLAVDHRRGGLGLTSPGDPMTLSQDLVDPLPGSLPAPRAQVVVNILPRRQIMRHHAPSNTASQNIEAAINDPPEAVVLLATLPLGVLTQRSDQFPLLIRQIRWVGFVRHRASGP